MSTTIDKTLRISEERARRLGQLAAVTGASEEALIEKALDLLFDLSQEANGADERREWAALGAPTLGRVWDNEADAVYDDWRQLYGIPAR